jgi:Spy/CpxP family protein refolding chaperone
MGGGMGVNIGPGGGMRSPNGPPNISGSPMHRRSALGLPGRWWNDKQVINRFNLRPNQQKQMDAVFEAHKAALTDSLQNLQRERAQLGSLSQKDLQDETKVLAAIDRVVAARADLAKQTTQVLTDLRKQLDPQQTEQLDKEISSTK